MLLELRNKLLKRGAETRLVNVPMTIMKLIDLLKFRPLFDFGE